MLVEFCRGSEVGLFDGLADRRCGLVYAERKLHMLDGAGEGIMASLTVALFLDGTFANHVGGLHLKSGASSSSMLLQNSF